MEKINIAELLKDCPSGMKLDCTMFDDLELDCIDTTSRYPIKCRAKHHDGGYNIYAFTRYGYWNDYFNSKCVIFPKGKTTWEGFVPPCEFKDGDIIYNRLQKRICIYHQKNDVSYIGYSIYNHVL